VFKIAAHEMARLRGSDAAAYLRMSVSRIHRKEKRGWKPAVKSPSLPTIVAPSGPKCSYKEQLLRKNRLRIPYVV